MKNFHNLFVSFCALTCITGALGYSIWSETPRGSVSGVVAMKDFEGKALEDCPVVFNGPIHRTVLTNKKGEFVVNNLPAGTYNVTTNLRHYTSKDAEVVVAEHTRGQLAFKLELSEPGMSVGDRQPVFLTSEKPFLPVHGYVDGKQPLKVQIWRTSLSKLLSKVSKSTLITIKSDWERKALEKLPDDVQKVVGKPVFEEDLLIKEADSEGFFNTKIPISVANNTPGFYLVGLQYGKIHAYSAVQVSDVAVVTKYAEGKLLAFAVNAQTGKPWEGVKVKNALTDNEGLVRLDWTTGNMLIATSGAHEAVIDRPTGYQGEEDGQESDTEKKVTDVAHIYTDRPVYRPGHLVSYKAIFRRKAANKSNANKSNANKSNANKSDSSTSLYQIPPPENIIVEVRDSEGSLVQKETKLTDAWGSLEGTVELNKEGATGLYSIHLSKEKSTKWSQSQEFMVASYKKPEYTVTVTPEKSRYTRGDIAKATIEARYFFGEPVASAKVHWMVSKETDWRLELGEEANNDDFDPEEMGYISRYGETSQEGDVTLDASGKAIISFATKSQKEEGKREKKEEKSGDDVPIEETREPQAETFTLSATATDSAERAAEGTGRVSVVSGEYILQVVPDGYLGTVGQAKTVSVFVKDAEGKPQKNIPVTLMPKYSIWDVTTKKTNIETLPTLYAKSDEAGCAKFSLVPPHSGEIEISGQAYDNSGHLISTEGHVYVGSDSDENSSSYYKDDLVVLTDKKNYQSGEIAKILIHSVSEGQQILLTVEGENIYKTLSLSMLKNNMSVSLPIEADWGADLTLSVCYVKEKKFASSTTPLRVRVLARELTVTVKPDREKVGPGEVVNYLVETRDAQGKPTVADCSLSVVDEAIYALRADDPAQMKRDFYPRQENRVETRHSFEREYLGDVSKAPPQIEMRKKFRDTAFWQASVHTDATGQARVAVTLPDNLTTWRASVRAVSETTQIGFASAKLVATKPFLVRLETPRYLVAGDKTRVLTLVHNDTGESQNAIVRLECTAFAEQKQEELTIAPGTVGKIEWPITARTTGPARIEVKAWTVNNNAQSYTDGLVQTVPIFSYGRRKRDTFGGEISGNNDANNANGAQVVVPIAENAIPSETSLTITVTPSVQQAMIGSLEYLVGYPYGCVEQTLSRFYPDLLATKVGYRDPELKKMVEPCIARLKRMQHESGVWGWWEYDKDDVGMTSYALIALSEAKRQGYESAGPLIARALEAAQKMKLKAKPDDLPLLCYALSQAGAKTEAQYPFRYSEVRTHLVPEKLSVNALAYLVLLDTHKSEKFYGELQRRLQSDGRVMHVGDREETAMTLRAMLAYDPNDARIPRLVRYLMQSRTEKSFGDTHSTSSVLAAFVDLILAHPEMGNSPSGSQSINIVVNGQVVQSILLATKEKEIKVIVPRKYLQVGNNTIALTIDRGRDGNGPRVFWSGALIQSLAAPTDQELPAFSITPGLTVTRKMPTRVKQGEPVAVTLTIKSDKPHSFVLIEERFPSGCETTERGTEESVLEGDWHYWYDHVDVRDDRIAFFAKDIPAGESTVTYHLRAQTPGRSHALPTRVEGMYDATVHAESEGTTMEVAQ